MFEKVLHLFGRMKQLFAVVRQSSSKPRKEMIACARRSIILVIQRAPLYIVQLTDVEEKILLKKIKFFNRVMFQRSFLFQTNGVIDVVIHNDTIVHLETARVRKILEGCYLHSPERHEIEQRNLRRCNHGRHR